MMQKNKSTIVLFMAAVFLIGIGIMTEEPADVMQKAIRICLECIGVG